MQLNQFKSLSIGDTVYCGDSPEKVTNQYIRVIENRPISFIEVDHGNPVPERMAAIFELGPHSKMPELRFPAAAAAEQERLRELQRAEYPESVPLQFMESFYR